MATRSKTKTAYRHEHADKRPHATARYIRIATRKCTIVADLIRGKSVKEAQAILTYCPKAAAAPMLKVLNSAVANAENNLELNRRRTTWSSTVTISSWPKPSPTRVPP